MSFFSHSTFRWAIFLGMTLGVGLWLRWIYPNPFLVEGSPIMVDSDCYTRLHRVALILQGKGWFWSFHDFENYPFGIIPHTTFPLDGLLVLLSWAMKPFTTIPLDWAGIFISPLLFGVLMISLFFLRFRFSLDRYSWAILGIGLAVMPGFVWATPFGRPDHQSLLMVLIFGALLLEPLRWGVEGQRFSYVLGGIWALAIWTSFYEPLVVLAFLVGINLLFRKREQLPFLGSCVVVVVISQVIDGFRFKNWTYLGEKNLTQWFHSIGETRSLSVQEFFLIFTIVIIFIPLLVYFYRSRIEDRKWLLVLSFMSLALVVMTVFQKRWLYFSPIPLVLLFSLIWKVMDRPLRWGLGLILLIHIYVSTMYLKSSSSAETPFAGEIQVLSKSIQGKGSIVAPWWISPSLLYYSGLPIVASSSHQSIEGTVEVSRFYMGTSWSEAEAFFQRRGVQWIVAYREDYVLENAAEVLGEKVNPSRLTWAHRLWATEMLPSALKLRSVTPQFRLYEYQP